MRYLKVLWHHEDEEQPVALYSEIDSRGYETRKIELFRDGRFSFADAKASEGGSVLGEVPVPSEEEIAAQGPFEPQMIKALEFEALWAVAARSHSAQAVPETVSVGASVEEKLDQAAGHRFEKRAKKGKKGKRKKGSSATALDILPRGGKWALVPSGDRHGALPYAEARTQQEAVKLARKLLQGGGTLTFHDQSGEYVRTRRFVGKPGKAQSGSRLKPE